MAAREHFADLLDRVAYGRERIVVTRHGRPVAAIVPVSDARRLLAIEARARAAEELGREPTVQEVIVRRLEHELGLERRSS